MGLSTGTPLRYPGGKGRIGQWLGELMRYNKISGGTYAEPYAGGAGAATYLLFSGYVNYVIINDIDTAIYAMWNSILHNTEEFLGMLEAVPININSWIKQKKIINNPDSQSLLDLGFAAFFLNRTNISGIIKGGVIGGKEQTGKYKMNARFNKADLAARIRRIAGYKNSISVHNDDAMDFIDKIAEKLPKKTMLYLDPPYYQKGSQLYRNHYKHDDHVKIAGKIKNIERPWLITYDDCETIRELYRDCPGGEFSLRYSAGLRRKGPATELMFYGNMELNSFPSLINQDQHSCT